MIQLAPVRLSPTQPTALRGAFGFCLAAACVAVAGIFAGPFEALADEPTHPNLKAWTWADDSFSSQAWPESPNPAFGGGDWVADVMYAAGGVSISDAYVREPGSKSVRFYVDATAPVPPDVEFKGQHRSEIRRYKWHEVVPVGTEEWHGFSYYFPPNYVHDPANRGVFMQLHAGRKGPPISLDQYAVKDHGGKHGAQVYINRRWGVYADHKAQHRKALGFEFEPGKWYDFVVHVVWDTEAGGRGLTELWVNGEKLYSERGGNTYDAGSDPGDPNLPYGGTLKLGFYKWPWREPEAIKASAEAGVKELEMYLGPVRTVRLAPGEHIGDAGYELVAPRPAQGQSESPALPPPHE